MCDACNAVRRIGIDSSPCDERLFHSFVVDAFHIDALCTADDGLEQLLRFFAYHEEDGALRGLFEEFQQFVGRGEIHPFGSPDNGDLVASLT